MSKEIFNEGKPVNFGNSNISHDESTPISFTSEKTSPNTKNTIDNVIHSKNENSQTGGIDAPQNYGSNTIAEFDMSQIYDFIEKLGYRAKWERSYLCTCVDPESMIPDINCPICHGSGIAYLPATELSIIVQSQNKGVKYQNIGLMDAGSALGTPQVGAYVTFRDRISIPDQLLVQSYIVNFDKNRITSGVRIPYAVNDFLLVMNNNGDTLLKDRDFTFNEDTHFMKPLSDKIGVDTIVTMNIEVELRYIVVDLLKQARYQYTQLEMPSGTAKFDRLPEYLLLKREDAWIGNSSFTGTKKEDTTGFVDPKRPMNPDTTFKSGGFGF